MLPSPKPWSMLISLILLPQITFATLAEPTLPKFPTPIPPSSLPIAYPNSLTAQNPIIDLQIRNTLAHYPLAIDGKIFSALSLIFTPDVIANYSAPLGVLTGLTTVKSTLEASLASVRTQHALSTEVIEILEGETTARSLTYVTATHFGVGAYYGEVVYAYAQYQDEWVRSCCPHEWRIKTRNQVYMMSALTMFNTIQAYISPAVTRTIYTGDPTQVTALSARTFGTWTLVEAVVRAYAAYHIGSPDAYVLALSTFGSALWHWGSEWLWFGTVEWSGVWPSLLLDVPSAVWMLTSWRAYAP